MSDWTKTPAGHELHAGAMRLATTDQRDRRCGWVCHVHADEYSEQMHCAGHFATEEEAKAAAVRFATDYCNRVLTALTEKPTRGGPTEAHPDVPYCKPDQSCCDFCCGN